MKGDFKLMYMCGYPTYCCPYSYGNNNNNDGASGSWIWIIIVLFILFFVFWGGNNNCRGNCFN